VWEVVAVRDELIGWDVVVVWDDVTAAMAGIDTGIELGTVAATSVVDEFATTLMVGIVGDSTTEVGTGFIADVELSDVATDPVTDAVKMAVVSTVTVTPCGRALRLRVHVSFIIQESRR